MVLSNQLNGGMIISLNGKMYRVESTVKVSVPKGTPFIKAKLRDLSSQELVEKSFKPNQDIKEMSLVERKLEFLYLEGKEFLFLDTKNLEQVLVPARIIGNRINYLKEGVELSASFYGDSIFSIELPQFLELMVLKIEDSSETNTEASRKCILETGAAIDIPPFIEVGDIIKVDTQSEEYIQRV